MESKIPLLSRLRGYGDGGNSTGIRGTDVSERLGNIQSLTEFLPTDNRIAIAEPLQKERSGLTHKRLNEFISKEFDLNKFGLEDGNRVSVLMPNGPELAVAMMAVMSRWCAAPINPTATWQEIKAEIQSTSSLAIVVLAGSSTNEAALQAVEGSHVGVIVLTPSGTTSGLFTPSLLTPILKPSITSSTAPVAASESKSHLPAKRTVLLLHTSGTSGNKKLVPYELDTIIIGVGCIVCSWNLGPNDVCLNMVSQPIIIFCYME